MNTVVVTGAGGFIGGALTAFLLDKGITVYGVDVSEAALSRHAGRENFVPVVADFTCYESLSSRIPAADVFYHFAWQGYGKDTQNYDVQVKNVDGAHKAASAAATAGCGKFVMACSSYEYQKSTVEGLNGVCNIYGMAKTAAKSFAKAAAHNAGMIYCGAIFTNVFGVGDRSSRSSNTIIKQLLEGKNIKSTDGNALYDWTYIDDVVGGMVAIGERGVDGKEYYVGSDRLRPFRDIITDVRDIISPDSEIEFGAYKDTSYVDYSGIDIYALYRDTGFFPRSDFRESIIKTAEWIKSANL